MKSIIEEASSISKAIENAWKEAQKPLEFSVRIFELPQKNLFGFTTKSAKIGIFFEESRKQQDRSGQTSSTNPKERNNQHKQQVPKERKEQAKSVIKPQQRQEAEQSNPWSPQMITFTQDWLKDLFGQLNINQKFSVSPDRYHLKVNLSDTIFDQEEKNRAFFRNCAYLLLQSMRNNFKRPLKGFKIILAIDPSI